MKNIALHPIRLLIIACFSLQVAWYSQMWVTYVRQADFLIEADFRAFYSAGWIARYEGISRVYDLTLERQVQEAVVGYPINNEQLLTYNHPPLLLPILWLVVNADYTASYVRYCLLLMAITAIGLPFLYQMLKARNWRHDAIWLTLAGTMLFEPLFISNLKGQDSALLLLGMILWMYGLVCEKNWIAGLGLALTIIRPQIAFFLAVPFLFRKRRVFGWFCLGVTLLMGYSYLLVGARGFRDFLYLLIISATGRGYGINEFAMFNFTGMMIRIFPRIKLDTIHALGWCVFFCAIFVLSVIWKQSTSIRLRHVSLMIALSLFVAPHLHYHDLTLVLFLVLCLAVDSAEVGYMQLEIASSLPVLVSVILLFSGLWDLTRYSIPYLLMFILVAGIWLIEKKSFSDSANQS